MKKLILTCALITSASVISFAQTQQAPPPAPTGGAQAPPRPQMTLEQRVERRAKMEEKTLSLTPDQYKVVYDAELEMMKTAEDQKKSGKQPDFQALNKAKEEKVKKVLTQEQITKYDAIFNRQGHGAPPAPMTPANQPKPTDAK